MTVPSSAIFSKFLQELICSTLQYREQKVAYHTKYPNAWISPVQHIGKQQQQQQQQQQQKYFTSKHKNQKMTQENGGNKTSHTHTPTKYTTRTATPG
jgi:hypothetical protein